MAREFKEYDKIYAEFRNKILEDDVDYNEASKVTKWRREDIVLWTRVQIRHAVYLSDTADQWQKFRVSLKGNTVKMKLYRLERRYAENIKQTFYNINYGWQFTEELTEEILEKIRIDNYIGALRRQNALDINYNIIKEI